MVPRGTKSSVKKILLVEQCRLTETCSYNHKIRSNYQNYEIKTLHEELKTLKAEIDTIKMNFKAVLSLQISVKYT